MSLNDSPQNDSSALGGHFWVLHLNLAHRWLALPRKPNKKWSVLGDACVGYKWHVCSQFTHCYLVTLGKGGHRNPPNLECGFGLQWFRAFEFHINSKSLRLKFEKYALSFIPILHHSTHSVFAYNVITRAYLIGIGCLHLSQTLSSGGKCKMSTQQAEGQFGRVREQPVTVT